MKETVDGWQEMEKETVDGWEEMEGKEKMVVGW